jgi:hypothetical protein
MHLSRLEVADGTFELSTARDRTRSSEGCQYLSICKMKVYIDHFFWYAKSQTLKFQEHYNRHTYQTYSREEVC